MGPRPSWGWSPFQTNKRDQGKRRASIGGLYKPGLKMAVITSTYIPQARSSQKPTPSFKGGWECGPAVYPGLGHTLQSLP